MKITFSAFTKGRNPRLYINPEGADTAGSYIEFVGGEYNVKYDDCERVSRRYHGDAELCQRAEDAVFESFKTCGFLSDGKGDFTMPPDAVLAFAARNALKAGLICFSTQATKKAWQKMELSFEVQV